MATAIAAWDLAHGVRISYQHNSNISGKRLKSNKFGGFG